ncbi:hypothetical protein [Aquabacterium sp.]|uniref:hypothetical protein n=1 Tax=Aquabacterium sp. TaxID=1872578 RepID=UPI0025BED64F|nr:hypothetical protein [Aquabacterium sp.]
MSSVYRANRKANDTDLIRLNSVGLSLATIANILGCHHTTVTQRLKALNVAPADTRRAFMEDVATRLTPTQLDWLADQLGPNHSVKDFITNLLTTEFVRQTQKEEDARP